jgi:hypothetical protein
LFGGQFIQPVGEEFSLSNQIPVLVVFTGIEFNPPVEIQRIGADLPFRGRKMEQQ